MRGKGLKSEKVRTHNKTPKPSIKDCYDPNTSDREYVREFLFEENSGEKGHKTTNIKDGEDDDFVIV